MNQAICNELSERYPPLAALEKEVLQAGEALIRCYENGGKLLICGNGGSCSDADHIVGELMKGFEHGRPLLPSTREKLQAAGGERGQYLAQRLQSGLPAISLTVHQALITAVANDIDANLIYAQQVMAYGKPGDILIAISTSGNSQNVVDAALTAKAMGLLVIGLTGASGGKLRSFCDILINVPANRTSHVQEYHLPVYHALCVMVETHFFGNRYLTSANNND